MTEKMNVILKSAMLLLVTVFYTRYVLCYNSHGIIHDVGELHWQKRLGATYLQFHPRTLIECAVACLLRSGRCKSINYSRQMLFCELNYNNSLPEKTTRNFEYSDIETWSKNLTGKCRDIKCNKNEMCSVETGSCSLSDCGPVDFAIPKNSALQNHGHHEVGNAVDFTCTNGYVMYNKRHGHRQNDGTVMCKTSGHWESIGFVCLVCKVDILQIDKMAELIHNLSSLTNQIYVFQCKSGYKTYKQTVMEYPVTVTCNTENGGWNGADFFCKKPETLLEDFCRHGYTFSGKFNVCYKYYAEKRTQEAAQKVCQQEHAHLLVITNRTEMEYLKSLPDDDLFYVDGIKHPGFKWTGWANQTLLLPDIKNDITSSDKLCLTVKNARIQLSTCDKQAHFVCQFEICPESAGYTYDAEEDICYAHFAPRQYTEDICTTTNAWGVQGFSALYRPFPIPTNKLKRIYEKQSEQQRKNFAFQKAYILETQTKTFWEAYRGCLQRNQSLAKIETEHDKAAVISLISNRTNIFIIGALLFNYKTYIYEFSDTTRNQYLPNYRILNSDDKHCIRIDKDTVYLSFKCSEKSRFICKTGDKTYELSSKSMTLNDALMHCNNRNATLLKIKSWKERSDVSAFLGNHGLRKRRDFFLIDLKLKGKNVYTYKWVLDTTYFTEDSGHFNKRYTNDTKDENRFVAFNTYSRKLELIDSQRMPYLCQTISEAAWEGHHTGGETAYATEYQNWKTIQVDKGNMLPFVCEIDTSHIIYRSDVFKKKQFKGD